MLDAKGHSTTGRCCSFDDGLDDEGANSPSLLIRQQLKVPNREVPVLSCDVDQPDALSTRDPDRLHPSATERATANPTVFAFGPVHYQLDLASGGHAVDVPNPVEVSLVQTGKADRTDLMAHALTLDRCGNCAARRRETAAAPVNVRMCRCPGSLLPMSGRRP